MAETLAKITDHGGETVSRIHDDNPFLDENGVLDSAALIELAAQSAAALDSFMHEKKVSPGMLAGVTDFMSLRSVRKAMPSQSVLKKRRSSCRGTSSVSRHSTGTVKNLHREL